MDGSARAEFGVEEGEEAVEKEGGDVVAERAMSVEYPH